MLGVHELGKAIQYVAALIGVIAFLVFFALAPFHALILCSLLVILGSMLFNLDKTVQLKALFLGVALMGLGILAILVPRVGYELLSVAEDLGRLLRLQP
jgi:chromate transport protein ChrA